MVLEGGFLSPLLCYCLHSSTLLPSSVMWYHRIVNSHSSAATLVPKTNMKRLSLSSSDSLVPICPCVPHGFPSSIMDGIDDDDEDNGCGDELCSSSGGGGGGHIEKKRRLSSDQVRSLEKSFEVENKLDPDRKARLAADLGLEPRQVAVWFQNRRARWKTKQLERDYSALKASHDALRLDGDALRRTNRSLLAELEALKAKLAGEDSATTTTDDNNSVKVEPTSSEDPPEAPKDGSPESDDSSAVANAGGVGGVGWSFQQELMKAEQGYGDEPCSSSFFADDQPPTLAWCCPESWGWADGRGEC